MGTPKMPGHTCRMIDKLKRRIEAAYNLSNKADSSEVDELEDIRSRSGTNSGVKVTWNNTYKELVVMRHSNQNATPRSSTCGRDGTAI
jgi:hypothetical protein